MNGPHDLGGAMGFGAIAPEPDEPVFHADWERRVFALVLAMGATGQWTIDQSRQARERIPPARYLASSYYEIWLAGLEALLAERGLLDGPSKPLAALAAARVSDVLAKAASYERAPDAPAIFALGQQVRARNLHPAGHTRLPRYARGHAGAIARVHGAHVFPDSMAAGEGERPRWLYTVRFSARELWGRDSPDTVSADLWESYLEPA